MPDRLICDRCGTAIAPHAHYVVRIDVFADPTLPSTTTDELEESNLQAEMAKLINQMKHQSAEELQDQVHRRFEFRLCRECQQKYLLNPLARPREEKPKNN